MNDALKALDDALYTISGGMIVRGGALTAKPKQEVRRRIRVFKRLDALRGPALEQREADEACAEEFSRALAGAGRDDTLDELFAVAAKTGTPTPSGRRATHPGDPKGRPSPLSPRLRTYSKSTLPSYL